LFYNSRADYATDKVIRETVEKGVTFRTDASLDICEFAVCPIMTEVPSSAVLMLQPMNVNRDLYIGIWIDGRRHLLALQEDDPKIEAKTKELFWDMYTNLTSSRRYSRITIWAFYTVSLGLSIVALVRVVVEPIESLFRPSGILC
jgi:hypothetical protein